MANYGLEWLLDEGILSCFWVNRNVSQYLSSALPCSDDVSCRDNYKVLRMDVSTLFLGHEFPAVDVFTVSQYYRGEKLCLCIHTKNILARIECPRHLEAKHEEVTAIAS